MSGVLQYLRDCELVIGPKESPNPIEPATAKRYRAAFVKDPQNPLRYTSGFRIVFNIDKTNESDSNKSKISIYNISQESRNFFEQKDLIVFLKAGYEGNISTIFFGDVLERSSDRSGPDIVTTIECGDQEQILKKANINLSLDKGATNIQAIRAAATAMQLVIPPNQLATIPARKFSGGATYVGLAKELLDQEINTLGFTWSIQDGEIQVVGPNSDNGQTAVLVTQDTGLIGFPTKTEDGLKFRTLLNPEIRIGRACEVRSKQFQGVFGAKAGAAASNALSKNGGIVVAKKVIHSGDTYGGDFSTMVEGQSKETDFETLTAGAAAIGTVA